MTGENVVVLIVAVALCGLVILGCYLGYLRDVRATRCDTAWDQASEALRGDGSNRWIGDDDDRARYERLIADRAWLRSQQALCEATPPKHSSWWRP